MRIVNYRNRINRLKDNNSESQGMKIGVLNHIYTGRQITGACENSVIDFEYLQWSTGVEPIKYSVS